MNYFKEDCPNCGEALSGKKTEIAYKQDEGLIFYCPKCLSPVPVTTKKAETTKTPTEPPAEPSEPKPEDESSEPPEVKPEIPESEPDAATPEPEPEP